MRLGLSNRIILLLGALGAQGMASDRVALELEHRFTSVVHPFLETYCFGCHGPEKQKGKLDLSAYSTVEAIASDYRRWDVLREKLRAEEMPPEDARRQPAPKLRQRIIEWIQAMREHAAQRNAGDPGPVPVRRLSNAEYDYTIRDLTGVDIRPAHEFPVDPANQAGFDNSAESLSMSAALLNKQLEAARRVAQHLVLTPDGIGFAPHPAITETDRDKYCVKRIVDFYQRQPTNLADYFMAAWRFKHRARLDKPNATLAEFAAADGVSPTYLATIWTTLTGTQDELGPITALQAKWRELPAPGPGPRERDLARRGCERMRDFVMTLHDRLRPDVRNLAIRGIAPGSQPFVLWKDRLYAANRRRYDPEVWRVRNHPASDGQTAFPPVMDPFLIEPADVPGRTRYDAAFERFCRVFPDAFYVSERVLVFLDEDKDSRGRLLSAGFHLMTGYYRDDAPLCELILDSQGRRELDALWDEFHFITLDAVRQYKDFIFFERAEPPRFMQGAEFDFARSEDQGATSEARIQQLAEAYVAKARRNGGEGATIDAIEDYFRTISADIRWVERARVAAEPAHLRALQAFAQRAYRRPLSQAERDDLVAYYRSLREKDGLDHEEAMRDTVVSVLVSPLFCYRIDLVSPGRTVRPLSDNALANRLSYFVWSSMPDDALMARATAGDLHQPRVLLAQVRRMLQDDRVRGLAVEFGGNWLDFRRFEEHNAVDRARFKSFNNELRQAMFEEPIRFFMDLVRQNRSVLDFLYANHTFVNPALARHYGMPEPDVRTNEWMLVKDARRYERGGLLPMSVFLTKNAPGLRTSPVKRGYWVVRRLLGEEIPPPPAAVPELPNDEANLGEITLPQALARHRADKSCAGCHRRFDAVGLVLEGYGPVGERRVTDFAGRPVEDHAIFPGGSEGTGLDGLRRYVREHRQEEFLDNLCRKLLAYALGRTLLLSDDGAVRTMRLTLQASGYRFGSLVETIVSSPQFLNQRGPAEPTPK